MQKHDFNNHGKDAKDEGEAGTASATTISKEAVLNKEVVSDKAADDKEAM